MTDERDRRRVITPPVGVRAQTAKPLPESWENDTSGVTPVDAPEAEVAKYDELHSPRRVREARDTALITLDRVGEVKRELKDEISKVERKVDDLGEHVGNLRESVARQEGQNEIIIGVVTELRDSRSRTEHVVTTTRLAEVEVDKTRQLSVLEIEKRAGLVAIDEREKNQDLKRKLLETVAGRVIVGIATAASVLFAGFMAGRC